MRGERHRKEERRWKDRERLDMGRKGEESERQR